MTSSAKKKKEKKKDFQKTQLKVGKAKPKPSNYTDTSFKARSIVIQSQSLSVDVPNVRNQFAHHISMLKNHSDTQRADSLAFLTNAMSQTTHGQPRPESGVTLLPKLQPLIVDVSPKVRHQLLKFFQCFPSEDVRPQVDRFLLYLHAAMTSLHASIRTSAMDVLDWLLEKAGNETVGCAGGWVKTLSCFQNLFAWEHQSNIQGGWSLQQRPSVRHGMEPKTLKRQLTTLNHFLLVGLGLARDPGSKAAFLARFPMRNMHQHLLPQRSYAYAYLNLFDKAHNDDGQMMEDRADRRRVFAERFAIQFQAGVNALVKEGGEVGRAVGQVKRTMEEGLSGSEQGIG